MNAARKGRAAEHRSRALLEAAGFSVCRAAGSRGLADLVAWDRVGIRFVSVKSGTRYASASERAMLRRMPRPANAQVEIHRWPPRAQAPLIEVL